MQMVLLFIVSVVLLLGAGCQSSKPTGTASVLQQMKVEWINDGGGGCIPELIHQPKVQQLLRNPQIYNELIGNLDSVVSTNSVYQKRSVPLGYVCLDILLKSVHENYYLTVFTGYSDDGLWSTVREAYYFPPDILKSPIGTKKMRSVQSMWQRLYEETDGMALSF